MNNLKEWKRLIPEQVLNAILPLRAYFAPSPYRPWHDDTRSIFIHIPKTAGSSISRNLYDAGPNHTKLKYYEAYDKNRFEAYFKFSLVRNPYDRFISAVRNARSVNEEGVPYHRFFVDQFGRDISFVDLFKKLRKRRNRKYLKQHVLFQDQIKFVKDLSGEIGLDWLGRFEQLDEVFRTLKQKFETSQAFEHINKSPGEKVEGKELPDSGYRMLNDMYRIDFEALDYEPIEP